MKQQPRRPAIDIICFFEIVFFFISMCLMWLFVTYKSNFEQFAFYLTNKVAKQTSQSKMSRQQSSSSFSLTPIRQSVFKHCIVAKPTLIAGNPLRYCQLQAPSFSLPLPPRSSVSLCFISVCTLLHCPSTEKWKYRLRFCLLLNVGSKKVFICKVYTVFAQSKLFLCNKYLWCNYYFYKN